MYIKQQILTDFAGWVQTTFAETVSVVADMIGFKPKDPNLNDKPEYIHLRSHIPAKSITEFGSMLPETAGTGSIVISYHSVTSRFIGALSMCDQTTYSSASSRSIKSVSVCTRSTKMFLSYRERHRATNAYFGFRRYYNCHKCSKRVRSNVQLIQWPGMCGHVFCTNHLLGDKCPVCDSNCDTRLSSHVLLVHATLLTNIKDR